LGSFDNMGTNAEFRPTFRMTENVMYVHLSSNFKCVSTFDRYLKCIIVLCERIIATNRNNEIIIKTEGLMQFLSFIIKKTVIQLARVLWLLLFLVENFSK
jgi:hypothetical protein